MVPLRKPGKDPTRPISYWPIALTPHVCKIRERMIMERLTYFLESRGLVSPHQSGFRKGRGTMDPVLCLEAEVRKAQVNKGTVLVVFFMWRMCNMWKEGLLIKLDIMGVGGRTYNWIKDFLF